MDMGIWIWGYGYEVYGYGDMREGVYFPLQLRRGLHVSLTFSLSKVWICGGQQRMRDMRDMEGYEGYEGIWGDMRGYGGAYCLNVRSEETEVSKPQQICTAVSRVITCPPR